MINLQQDMDGFIRMIQHYPKLLPITITFQDGTVEEVTGAQLNELFDQAVADYRVGNKLDARGFDRAAGKKAPKKTSISLVPVKPGLSA